MVKCTTKKQFEELVRQMELNQYIGRGIRAFGETKASAELVWTKVFNKLNGAGPSEELTLSPLEQSVADLLQIDLVVNPNGNIFGVSQKENTPELEFYPEKYNEQQQEIDEPQKKKQQEPQKKNRRTKIQSSPGTN